MIAIVLGSGFSPLISFFTIVDQVSYNEILDFDFNDLEGHERIMYYAKIKNEEFIILSGKLHAYEGYTYSNLIAPLCYINEKYSISKWIITSASGALNPSLIVGEWYRINGIISLMDTNFLNGNALLSFSETFGKSYLKYTNQNITYAFQQGPSLGTISEYVMLSKLGADSVGMSMLPELLYLNSIQANAYYYTLPVCAYDIDGVIVEPTHEEVVSIAQKSVHSLVKIIYSMIN